jgi:hypothetical protein
MKQLLKILLITCVSNMAFGQVKPVYERTKTEQLLSDFATWSKQFMLPPTGATPAMPTYIPDAQQDGALWNIPGTAGKLKRYNKAHSAWEDVSPDLTAYASRGNRYILATGQSNANGVNLDAGNTEIDTTSNPRVLAWNGSAWVVAKVGVSPFSCATPFTLRTTLLKSIGAPYFFAKKLQQQTGDTIRVYMMAWGGESINNWTGTTSKNWHFIDSVITSTIGSKKIEVMTWQQGEIDSAVLGTYRAKFDSVYHQLHTASWAQKITPIIIGAATPRFQSVNLTQRYISTLDSLNIFYASMADIAGGVWQYDTTHWSAKAQSELGGRFLSVYNNLFRYKFYDLFSSNEAGDIDTKHQISAPSFKITGTGGKGVIEFKYQSAITAPPANTLWAFATNLGNLAWRNPNNIQTSIISIANTASRGYTLPDTTGKFLLETNIAPIKNKNLADISNAFPIAAADGSTKGDASFNANDFDSSGGNINIDYPNGQSADATHKGFLPSADWNTFNDKAPGSGSINYIQNQQASEQNANIWIKDIYSRTIQAANSDAGGMGGYLENTSSTGNGGYVRGGNDKSTGHYVFQLLDYNGGEVVNFYKDTIENKKPITAPNISTVVASANISATNSSTDLITYVTPNTGTPTMFTILGSVNISAISGGDVLQFRVIYKDVNNNPNTLNFGGGLTTIAESPRNNTSIVAYPNTTITVQAFLTTATGTITYKAQSALIKVVTF